ncbi:hypothetical protein [Sinomicrobium sp. M5D2P9]
MKKLLLLLFVVPLVFYGQTVTNLASGNHVSVNIPATGHTAYTRAVILLHAIYDGELISKNYTVGSLVAIRGSGNDRTNVAHINTSSGHNGTHGSVTSVNNYISSYSTEQWKLKKVRYNGVLYLALEVPYRNYQHNAGFRFTGWMTSTAPEQMKLVSYYHTQQNTVLHEEVYNSLEDFIPNNAEYHQYQKSVFSGKVAIGTDMPDAELTVNGKIHTKEVKVDLDGFAAPDYVFDDNYDLRSLDDVEKYIKENRHLPGIPSAVEMEEEGVNLKGMNMKLLEKVEELTLYVLELKNENRQQQKLLEALIRKDKINEGEIDSKKDWR